MPRQFTNQPRCRQTVLAIAAITALTHSSVYALELAESPPGTKKPYVAPNVIISIDDSGSMGFRLDSGSATGAINDTSPRTDGTWPPASRRMNVLKYALNQVFNDTSLLPDKKIRLSWQAMWNNGNSISKYNDLSYWYGGNTNNPGRNKTPGANNVGSENKNSMKILDATHRSNFLEFVNYLLPENGTPSHLMFKQADEYLRKKDRNSKPIAGGPWSSNPGGNDTLSQEFLGCRRNYHIMMTDGRWNGTTSGGNRESRSIELPDETQYTANSNQTRVYYDNYADNLADWAFYSWSNNLQPSIYDKKDEKKQISLNSDYRKAPDSEVIGGTSINKYWNPKYNPANWPHLVTYTIGFSEDAITWPGASNINAPTEKVPFGYDGSFPDLISGSKKWPEMNQENRRALDLWHTAINGRGRFYAVSKGEDLEKAFREIISVISIEDEQGNSSVAATGKSYGNNPVGLFTTSNMPSQAWKGEIRGIKIETAQNRSPVQTKLWEDHSTADILDSTAPNSRTILTWKEPTATTTGIGQAFRWSNLSGQQQTCLHIKPDQLTPANCSSTSSTSRDTQGEKRLNYIRGDRTNESISNGFRARQSRQGDIVNSNVWYTGAPISNYSLKGYADFLSEYQDREPMIYVGGNDGMLHGFSTENGTEKIAYIPRGVIPNLTRLTWPSFDDNHRYFVDGSPMTGDVDIKHGSQTPDDPDWRTMLVGTLGAGGKGYFVLDVTNPKNFEERNAASLVIMDQTLASNENIPCVTSTPKTGETACINHPQADIGHIFAVPSTEDNNPLRTGQITQLNNNRWGVIMGNGYNSKNGRPVLLIQYLDGNKELLRIPATGTTTTGENVNDNGLSAPRLVDINNDGRPDAVYAGDLKGNMWKFMINTQDHSQWSVAFSSKPLFTARGGTSGSPNSRTLVQSITVPPTIRANDRLKTTSDKKTLAVGGMMIAFGTGRNITTADPENTDRQTLYSVLDNTRYTSTRDQTTQQNYVAVHPGDVNLSIPAPSPLGTGLDSNAKQVLLAQQIVGQQFAGTNDSEGRTYWQIDPTSAKEEPSVNWNTQHGWYLDLPATGERLLKPISLYDGSNILAIYTQVPAKGSDIQQATESCEATVPDEERQYLTLINIMDGRRPSVQLMDMSGDGFYDLVADNSVSRMQVVRGAHRIIQNETDSTDFGKDDSFNLARMPEQSLRPNWRQLK